MVPKNEAVQPIGIGGSVPGGVGHSPGRGRDERGYWNRMDESCRSIGELIIKFHEKWEG